MARELDVRERHGAPGFSGDREVDLRQRAAFISERMPGSQGLEVADLDPETGNANRVRAIDWPARTGNYVQRALSFAQQSSPALGITDVQDPSSGFATTDGPENVEFIPDPNYQTTSQGAVAVNMRQAHQGIPVFEAAQTVRFSPQGAVEDMLGRNETVPYETRHISPELSVTEAVRLAAEHVSTPGEDEREEKDQFGEALSPSRVDVEGFEPAIVAVFDDLPARPSVLESGPFAEPIKASLTWFPIQGEYHLTWRVITTMPDHAEKFLTLVDATEGEILYCKDTSSSVAAQRESRPRRRRHRGP